MSDYLLIGAGLFNCVLAHQLTKANKTVTIVEGRKHIGGNCYTEAGHGGIELHMYGPHVFHTDDHEVWNFVNQFSDFNRFSCHTKVNYKGEVFSFPINLTTLNQVFKKTFTPEMAKKLLIAIPPSPGQSLEEYGIKALGKKLYEIFIKGYTEKQWGISAKTLPASILKRLPVRTTYNDDYFNDQYEGIPVDGYTKMMYRMVGGADIITGMHVTEDIIDEFGVKNVVCTGKIDEFFNYKFGILPYRSLKFESEVLSMQDYQGNAIMNYTEKSVPYTRIVEHKHFVDMDPCPNVTVITREYPQEWNLSRDAYYPIRDVHNKSAMYDQYKEYAKRRPTLYFKGRLGEYQYYNMDQIVRSALDFSRVLIGGSNE